MDVLLVKTSSMGDIIHTLPALSDAACAIPNIRFDWVIEEAFAEIPAWHSHVDQVIPVSLRQWRKHIAAKNTRTGWVAFIKTLRQKQYDLILDAQGLVKSALIPYFAKGLRVGLDWRSARESLASLTYQRKCRVNFYQHAIHRMRELFHQAFHYPLPKGAPDFGLDGLSFSKPLVTLENYVVFLHGTTWASKQWPEVYWQALAKRMEQAGCKIKISGGNEAEMARAERIAEVSNAAEVLPRLSILEMANLLLHAKAAVAVDTGFGHLAAALGTPTVSIYGPTDPCFTGALGRRSSHLASHFACSPCLSRACQFKGVSSVKPACFMQISPDLVWERVKTLGDLS